jgi:hypothetical protein
VFTQQETDLRKPDSVKIARQFAASPFVYGADSKQRTPNPESHPVICQREDGSYCDVEGRSIPRERVPQYILDQGKPPRHTSRLGGEVTLADAMKDAMTPADPRDTPARKTAAKRGRK